MRLFEHEEFEQAMLRAAEHFGVSEQFVEKDYYVTEILRVVTDRLGDRAMFKGGTSLSKGWGLITRFSEDIDLFVNPDGFNPRPGKNKMDKILKELAEDVGEHPALNWLRDESVTIGRLGRADYFGYDARFVALPGIRAAVRLEPGVQSGTFPTEMVPITSLVGQYLQEQRSGAAGPFLREGHVFTADSFVEEDATEADVEDMLGRVAYARLVKNTYGLSAKDALPKTRPEDAPIRVVSEVERHFKTLPPEVPEFDHFPPARHLLENPSVLDGDSDAALERFEKLFVTLNALL